ncbi:methyltransferase domain-containing protein [Salinicoccus cyprini]|uniref:Methyltransferase domain-containing protein n=1 Tax=Salinicoccus cyprini TaxID=2493691 RepID=A0A558B014_9STAP|nr:class I SAM-dependent methyltransferase [Salinicoccus cyprini]TVT29869.1 methyltransferase domain-containing protein [Salinicoccus cyprini]
MKSSPTYQLFSHYYDELTYDMPYALWLDIIHHYGKNKQTVLDIGCGTGRLTRQLGFQTITGMDQSDMMLDVARRHDAPNIEYVQGDMRDFDLGRTFDMVTATVDVLNYCSSPDEVIQVLKQVYEHLASGGIFIFDIHSSFKMNEDFNDVTYSDETDHITYIWHALQGEAPLSVVHDMTFFIKDADDPELYRKVVETHSQRTYTHMEMLQLISRSGFTIDAAFSDFDMENAVTEVCDRVFYVLKK